jgi:hypothetical protein
MKIEIDLIGVVMILAGAAFVFNVIVPIIQYVR